MGGCHWCVVMGETRIVAAQSVCQRRLNEPNRTVCRHLFLIYAQTQLSRKPSAYTFNLKTANGRAVRNFTDGLKICVRD